MDIWEKETESDPELDAQMNELIKTLGKAQPKDINSKGKIIPITPSEERPIKNEE